MEKNKENTGLYSVGLTGAIISVAGFCAVSLCRGTRGFFVGAGLAVVAFFAQCLLFANSDKLARTRSKGIVFGSTLLVLGYVVLFVLGDMARLPVFRADGTYAGLGITALVFQSFCLAWSALLAIRLVGNLFGKELGFYERLLGTDAVRREQADSIPCEFARKDTDKLVAEAERTVFSSNIAMNTPVFPSEADSSGERLFSGAKPEARTSAATERVTFQNTSLEQPSQFTEEEPTEANGFVPFADGVISVQPEAEAPAVEPTEELPSDNIEAAEPEIVPEVVSADGVIAGEPVFSTLPADEASVHLDDFARDVRREYVVHSTTQKSDDEDDSLYTDFSYGSEDGNASDERNS